MANESESDREFIEELKKIEREVRSTPAAEEDMRYMKRAYQFSQPEWATLHTEFRAGNADKDAPIKDSDLVFVAAAVEAHMHGVSVVPGKEWKSDKCKMLVRDFKMRRISAAPATPIHKAAVSKTARLKNN